MKLDIVGLSKRFGNITALDDVTLQVDTKEYVCVVGPSGCGKSTLIKCIAGIIEPEGGEILIDGRPTSRIPIENRNIGYVFQEIALFPHLTVRDNVSYGLTVRGEKRERITAITNEMLDLINMRERSRSQPTELSGGAQQKVAVGRAIATRSDLLLFDEPLGALDALVRAELRYELRRLASDLGLTVIHVTHDQEEALSIADRVVIMKLGRIVEVGKPSEIYHSPKSLFTENFVGETNLLEGVVLESSGSECEVRFASRTIRIPISGKEPGERVVAAIRPEFVGLVSGTREAAGWKARIKQVTFLGAIRRFVLESEEGLQLVAHIPASAAQEELNIDDTVYLHIDAGKHMLLFDYPEEGLEKQIALE